MFHENLFDMSFYLVIFYQKTYSQPWNGVLSSFFSVSVFLVLLFFVFDLLVINMFFILGWQQRVESGGQVETDGSTLGHHRAVHL